MDQFVLIAISCLFCHYAQITVFTLKFSANALLFAGLCFTCLSLKSSKVWLPLPYERTKTTYHNLFSKIILPFQRAYF